MRSLVVLAVLVTPWLAAAEDAGVPPAADAGTPSAPASPVDAPALDPPPVGPNSDAGSAEVPPTAPVLERFVVTYHEQEAPLAFRVASRGRSARERASDASRTLGATLDLASEADVVPEVSVRLDGAVARVYVGDSIIASLTEEDAAAEGERLSGYAKSLEAPLVRFVQETLKKQSLAEMFLAIFLAVFGLVLGFLTLRALGRLFDRLDATLDEKRGHLKPIELFRVPVFSGDAVGGGLALAASIGRVITYIACVLATFAFALSRFDATRPLVARVGEWSGGPILRGLESFVSAIPGIILAALLVVLLRAGLRVLNLLLDGVQGKRVKWKKLPPERVAPFRFVAATLAVLVFAPLFVAAIFGQFGTPLEVLALGASGVVLIAAVPVVANYAVGISIVWRGVLRPGDWVQVGDIEGEVTAIAYHEICLVPDGGGRIDVPALYLLTHPLKRLRGVPEVSFDVTVARDRPAKELLTAMKEAVVAVEQEAKIEAIDICHAWIKIRVFAPSVRDRVREQLLIAISDAADRHEFELPILHAEYRKPLDEPPIEEEAPVEAEDA